MNLAEEVILTEKVELLTKELDSLRAIVLSVGEFICQSIVRLPKEVEPVLNSDIHLALVTTADAEVTHA